MPSDAFGRSASFSFGANGLVSALVDASGATTRFEYGFLGNLTAIYWPDGAARRFVYENPAVPWALTGVVDENGARHATFDYDASGSAVSTAKANGVDAHMATRSPLPSTIVTESSVNGVAVMRWRSHAAPVNASIRLPSGALSTVTSTLVEGLPRVTSYTQPAGSGCAAATSQQTYDGAANITSRVDFNGNRTCYAHDAPRRLELVRVEGVAASSACGPLLVAGAALPAGARKITTEWHPDWPVPIRTAEARRITFHAYNGQPDILASSAAASCAPASALLPDGKPIAVVGRRTVQATTDTNGRLGFGAAAQAGVTLRESRWTYNASGQVLSEDGPRTDVNDSTTYQYYATNSTTSTAGDLQRITTPTGRTTTFTRYDRSGRVLESVDANGVATTVTYDVRGRVTSIAIDTAVTTYAYDLTGPVSRVTRADGSFVGYQYDAAHRLTGVADSAGNRTAYTLDAYGNRLSETTLDPYGNPRRTVDRWIDPLGRVARILGEE